MADLIKTNTGYMASPEKMEEERKRLREEAKKAQLRAEDLKETPEIKIPEVKPENEGVNKALDLTADISGLYKQLIEAGEEYSASLKKTREEKESKMKELKNKIVSVFQKEKPVENQILQKFYQFGGQEALNQVKTLIPEVENLRNELTKLKDEEALSIERLYGQGRGIPLNILRGQENRLRREFAIRESSLASQIAAKAATIQALQGNISNARILAQQAVQNYLYERNQKLKEYQELWETNRDIIDMIGEEARRNIQNKMNLLMNEIKQKENEKQKVMNLMLKYPLVPIDVNDDYEEAIRKTKSWLETHPEEKKQKTTILTSPEKEKFIVNPETGEVIKRVELPHKEFITPQYIKQIIPEDVLYQNAIKSGFAPKKSFLKKIFGIPQPEQILTKEAAIQVFLNDLMEKVNSWRKEGWDDKSIVSLLITPLLPKEE